MREVYLLCKINKYLGDEENEILHKMTKLLPIEIILTAPLFSSPPAKAIIGHLILLKLKTTNYIFPFLLKIMKFLKVTSEQADFMNVQSFVLDETMKPFELDNKGKPIFKSKKIKIPNELKKEHLFIRTSSKKREIFFIRRVSEEGKLQIKGKRYNMPKLIWGEEIFIRLGKHYIEVYHPKGISRKIPLKTK